MTARALYTKSERSELSNKQRYSTPNFEKKDNLIYWGVENE